MAFFVLFCFVYEEEASKHCYIEKSKMFFKIGWEKQKVDM